MSQSNKHIDLSIVIVNYNVRYFLEQCIWSVLDACNGISAEIIVVDNNSKDDSCKMIKETFDKEVVLIENKENTGFSKANNQGVAIAKGEYVLILNPDTVVPENCFSKILNFAKSKEDFGALGVKLIDGKGHFLPESKRNVPTALVSLNKFLPFSKNKKYNYYANHISQNQNGKVAILVGAFMLMKKKVYEQVNGFDEDYFMYGEDIDLSYKIIYAGYHNYYFGNSSVIHYKGESTVKNKKNLSNFYDAMKIFYQKHFKYNWMTNLILKAGIKSIYLLKIAQISLKKEKKKKNIKFIYIGSNASTFTKLKLVNENILAIHYENILINDIIDNQVNMLIFDTNFIKYSSIINAIISLKSKNIAFRFIPKNSNFYIGSDRSKDKGLVKAF